jgi:L-fuconate dehydratase
MLTIVDVHTYDIRFPTSRTLAGSDAMHSDPDYAAAYVVLQTDHPAGLEGHGMTFTIGRGNEVCVTAIRALAPLVIGRTLESFTSDMRAFWRQITGDSQLRWIGPEKGVIHLATAAVVNAVWDLWAKVEGKPLWKLLTDMTPEQLVSCIDYRYITDVLTPDEALDLLYRQAATRARREAEMLEHGFPAYTTGAGWSGYSDEQMRLYCREALANGWRHFKLKVGLSQEDDLRRAHHARRDRAGEHLDVRRKPGMGGERGHRCNAAPGGFRPPLDVSFICFFCGGLAPCSTRRRHTSAYASSLYLPQRARCSQGTVEHATENMHQ